jgi:cyclopropane fatty-acyl-phospholipid synthase-like methyltransferase
LAAGASIAEFTLVAGVSMKDSLVSKYYDEQYYGRSHSDDWIKLPFRKQDYYGLPLQLLDCRAGERLLDVACGSGQLGSQ